MAKQQCKTCGEWFDDSIFDIHLQEHLQEPAKEEKKQPRLKLRCPLCIGTKFDRESGFLRKSFAFGGHNIEMAICRKCSFHHAILRRSNDLRCPSRQLLRVNQSEHQEGPGAHVRYNGGVLWEPFL